MQMINPIQVTPASLVTNVPLDSDAPPWAAGTYGLDAVVSQNNHIYKSLTSGNTVSPADDTGAVKKWLDLGATNPWRMFDKKAGNKWILGQTTTRAENITVSITTGQVFNALTLFGLVATEVVVIMTDPVEGIVHQETHSMTDYGVSNWYEYFFKPIGRKQTLVLDELPSYGTATLKIEIKNPGGIAAVNTVVFGPIEEIGVTQYDTSFGIRSFSTTKEDEFGAVTIVSRGFRRVVDYDIIVDTWDIDRVMGLLEPLRDTPCVFIGYKGLQYTITMGLYQDLTVTVKNWSNTGMSLEVRSLN